MRFIPYLQLHEFEGLLFSDPAAFARGVGRLDLSDAFRAIRQVFATPEDINNDRRTAPSKRIEVAYPAYQKVTGGTLAAQAVGLPAMRRECPRFGRWVDRLVALAASPV